MSKKLSLKEASKTLKVSLGKFKTAQDEGSLGPEEVKDIIEDVVDMAETIADLGMAIEEGVPGGEVEEPIVEEEVTEPVVEEEIEDRENISQKLAKNKSARSRHGADHEDENETLELKEKVSQLTKDLDAMKTAQKKEKLAQKYAQNWPEPMREAKVKEFMGRKGNLAVLEAQVTEAISIMGDKKAIKVAAMNDDTFSITHFDNDNSNTIAFGSKC